MSLNHSHVQQKDMDKRPREVTYWRSLEHRERTQAYVDYIKDEFKEGDSEITHLQRRQILKLMGASVALSGMSVACRRPKEAILPYTHQPEGVIPGIPKLYASSMPGPHGALGILVESHEGRPTKIEGNPLHPASLGKTDVHAQAAILELYDPDRSRVPKKAEGGVQVPVDPSEFEAYIQDQLPNWERSKGKGIAFLVGEDNGPTFFRLQKQIEKKIPESFWVSYDPLRFARSEKGAEKAFGIGARVLWRLDRAKVICCLQGDPLMQGPHHVRHAHDFGKRRKVHSVDDVEKMNRLYVAEAAYSVTGTNADHRLPLSFARSNSFLITLAQEILPHVPKDALPANDRLQLLNMLQAHSSQWSDSEKKWIQVLARDLVSHASESVILLGEGMDETAHALSHMLNWALGGLSNTFDIVKDTKQTLLNRDMDGLKSLLKDMRQGAVHTLFILDGNPSYALPAALGFEQALKQVSTVVHLGLYEDETAQMAHWHLPKAHFLESFGDAFGADGSLSIVQPLIAPLHQGRCVVELLAYFLESEPKSAYALVERTFLERGLSKEQFLKAIHDGVVEAQSNHPLVAILKKDASDLETWIPKASQEEGLEVVFGPSYAQLDGRMASLGWLQELPDPITKMAWDNAALLSPALAKQVGIQSRVNKRLYEADVVELTLRGRRIQIPAFIMPGVAKNTIVLSMGYGRKKAGVVGTGVGVDVFSLMPDSGAGAYGGVKLHRTSKTKQIATTQEQFAMNGDAIREGLVLSLFKRDPARDETAQSYVKDPLYVKKKGLTPSLKRDEKGDKRPIQVTNPWSYERNKWGMSIDLSSCIGCNACVIACQAENNIPVVGRDQVMRGRVMHWIRVDRYFTGDVHNPKSVHQPVNCMHCENAPCEPVCPVAATTHDTEGLNAMAYNRCIGTRYCANNCPYKVRRFNYLDFSHSGNIYVDALNKERSKLLKMQANPDVTVRYRGVMEKCTYCTQRIQEAKMIARREGQDPNAIADGAVTPACAQVCPTNAIVFGNLNDPQSKVSLLKKEDRNYDLLEELNTRPRTSYLSKLRNPNPELERI